MRRLWPQITPGKPGTLAPAPVNSGQSKWTKYPFEGKTADRWGSQANSARPVSVRSGAIAQLLLPSPGAPSSASPTAPRYADTSSSVSAP